MRHACKTWFAVATLTLYAMLPASAQAPNSKPSASPASETKTIVGCLTSSDGRYTLGTNTDKLYVLQCDPELLGRYNVVLVRVTGVVSEAKVEPSKHDALSQQPPTIAVSKLKKIADGCN
jgi:hypothetical protein